MDTSALNYDHWIGLTFDLGGGLQLRRFRETDADAVFETVKRNEKHLYFMQWITSDYSLEMASEFIERSNIAETQGEALSLGIFRDGNFIGSIGFVYFDRAVRKTEIGYWLDAAEEGKGIVSMATGKLIDWAFDVERMNRIEIRCAVENIRSAAVPKRFGFMLEGHLRESEFRFGRLVDFYIFGLLAADRKNKDQ